MSHGRNTRSVVRKQSGDNRSSPETFSFSSYFRYPINDNFISQKRRWMFLERYPRCYHPCSINCMYRGQAEVPSTSVLHFQPSEKDELLSEVIASVEHSSRVAGCAILLEDLPEHIHIDILKYVHPCDRFKLVSLVSKYWHNLVNRGVFWREIRIQLRSSSTRLDSLRRFLSKAQMHVEKMSITVASSKPLPDTIFLNLFPALMPRMKVLDIGFYPYLTARIMEFFVKCFPNLEELNVEGTKTISDHDLTDSVYSAFMRKGFPCLKKVFISYCPPFSRETYRQFCLIDRPIEVLSVDGDSFLGSCAAAYLAKSSFITTLTRLYLDGEELDDDGFYAVTACKNLKLLSISFCENLTDTSLRHTKTLVKLEHLHLRKGKEFTADGLLELFKLNDEETTDFPRRMQFLNLSECPAVDDSVVDVITKSCPGLQSLNLAWNWLVTDAGFNLIVERLKNLQFLDMMGMDFITSSALLYAPGSNLPKLRFICIAQCPQFDETSTSLLQLRKKDLVIVNYHGYYCTFTLLADDISFVERCDLKYVLAVNELFQECQGFCCMSALH